jgi:DnaK suppressor protein
MDLAEIKQQLELHAKELTERQDRVARHTRHREEPLPQDFAEQAVELENGETLVAIDRELTQELQQVEQALRRIEAGAYFDCAQCGKPIGEQRLLAIPYANSCIACASAD